MSNKPLRVLTKNKIEPIINELGYELVDVEYKNPGGPWKLIIYIYKPEGILMEDCERVSRALDPILDEDESITGRYDFLQVSSPGLDREFKSLADYKRYVGKDINVSLYAPIESIKKLKGKLNNVSDKTIIIVDNEKEYEIEIKNIGKATLTIEF